MCECDWCANARRIQAGLPVTQQSEYALLAYRGLSVLKRRVREGDFADDLYSPARRRLEFYQRLYQEGKLSEFPPAPPSRFEALIAELMTRPVVSVADLVAEERMRRMIPASDEQEERYP